jgi:hypothetical protein
MSIFARAQSGLVTTSVVMMLAIAVGCDSSRGVVPVAGTIRFAGKAPPNSGYVYFVPLDPSAAESDDAPRSGTALFTKDGSFEVSTFREGDGLRPGRYEARVDCSLPAEAHAAAKSAVPASFKPPEVTISEDGPRPVMVEIDVR